MANHNTQNGEARPGRRIGDAGVIVGGGKGTTERKYEALQPAGNFKATRKVRKVEL
jgi:succinyl-CoA synthetase alpha subunit